MKAEFLVSAEGKSFYKLRTKPINYLDGKMKQLRDLLYAFETLNIHALEQVLATHTHILGIPKLFFLQKFRYIFADTASQIHDYKAYPLQSKSMKDNQRAYCFINSVQHAYLAILVDLDPYMDVVHIQDVSEALFMGEFQLAEDLGFTLDTTTLQTFKFYEELREGYDFTLTKEASKACDLAVAELVEAHHSGDLDLAFIRSWLESYHCWHNNVSEAEEGKIYLHRETISDYLDFFEEIQKMSKDFEIAKSLRASLDRIHSNNEEALRTWYDQLRAEMPDCLLYHLHFKRTLSDDKHMFLLDFIAESAMLQDMLQVLHFYGKYSGAGKIFVEEEG